MKNTPVAATIRGACSSDESGHRAATDHMWSIITCPKPEHDTCVAPSIRRAKS
jgi:hypothetical protein